MDGGDLEVVIRDRGPGIPDAVMQRIGEPFFTTKAPGRGMGLGLFLARAVIEGVGGSLQIDSAKETGTEVCARLPIDVGVRSADAGAQSMRSAEPPAIRVVSKPP
jgi:two-component system sensor histidine kinase RegB